MSLTAVKLVLGTVPLVQDDWCHPGTDLLRTLKKNAAASLLVKDWGGGGSRDAEERGKKRKRGQGSRQGELGGFCHVCLHSLYNIK